MLIRPLIIAALATATIATPAFAESITVEYHDLDLSTEAGRATLGHRLDAAARQVCGLDEAHTGTRFKSNDARKCFNEARKDIGEKFAALTANGPNGG